MHGRFTLILGALAPCRFAAKPRCVAIDSEFTAFNGSNASAFGADSSKSWRTVLVAAVIRCGLASTVTAMPDCQTGNPAFVCEYETTVAFSWRFSPTNRI